MHMLQNIVWCHILDEITFQLGIICFVSNCMPAAVTVSDDRRTAANRKFDIVMMSESTTSINVIVRTSLVIIRLIVALTYGYRSRCAITIGNHRLLNTTIGPFRLIT